MSFTSQNDGPLNPGEASTSSDCPGCTARRDFLRGAGLSAIGLFLGLGASPAEAAALPVRLLEAPSRERRPAEARYPIPAADGATVDRANEVLLARYRGAVYAFALSCPHQNTALRWQADQARFECPKHHSKYAADGIYISGRATRSMDRLAIRLDGNAIVVDPDKAYRQDRDAAEWQAALVKV